MLHVNLSDSLGQVMLCCGRRGTADQLVHLGVDDLCGHAHESMQTGIERYSMRALAMVSLKAHKLCSYQRHCF